MTPDITSIAAIYRRIAEESAQESARLQRDIYRTGTLRLLLFVAGVAGVIYFHEESWGVLTAIVLVTLVPFMLLVKYHNRLFYRKDYAEKRREVNEQELAVLLNHDSSAFDGGKEFADPAHLYTHDIDVFGEDSLFQYINRTVTHPGRKRLAERMSQHLEQKTEIVKHQQAVRELAPLLHFRQRFRILGLLHKGGTADESELNAWAKSPSTFHNKPLLRLLPPLVTGINAVCLVLLAVGLLPGTLYGLIWSLFVLAATAFTKRITRLQSIYGKKLQVLSTYATLLQLMDEQPMQTALLRDIKERIGGEKRQASQSIRRLNRLMDALNQRNNMLMYILLNGFFFWELRQIMRIEAWKEQHADELPRWIAAIGETDALCSLATFAYNHPDYTYPTLLDEEERQRQSGGFCLSAKALGHPLMPADRCVRNDIQMQGRPAFTIITGANMAGKSTYLRTVGVNFLLACIGAPVCARQMTLSPVRLITSLRTSDSLTDNESYFFAELKRLKLIIDKLQNGEKLFIILDEILKGTNSMDKQKGSMALIRQFMRLQANGIIATHDLLLGTLADSFPENISNHCFEADIANNELTFSYRMRSGVAQNMNACFLMKKMGIAMADD